MRLLNALLAVLLAAPAWCATHTIYFADTSGQTIYAYPHGVTLANWATSRVLATEGTSPDLGRYSVTVDDAVGTQWELFVGATQPGSWAESIGAFSVATASTLGTPVASIAADIATRSSQASVTTVDAKLGSPAAGSVAADLAVVLDAASTTPGFTGVLVASSITETTGTNISGDTTGTGGLQYLRVDDGQDYVIEAVAGDILTDFVVLASELDRDIGRVQFTVSVGGAFGDLIVTPSLAAGGFDTAKQQAVSAGADKAVLEFTLDSTNTLDQAPAKPQVTFRLDATQMGDGDRLTVHQVVGEEAGAEVTVGSFTQQALAAFATTDTGQGAAASGSVAALAQGAGGVAPQPTALDKPAQLLRIGRRFDGVVRSPDVVTIAPGETKVFGFYFPTGDRPRPHTALAPTGLAGELSASLVGIAPEWVAVQVVATDLATDGATDYAVVEVTDRDGNVAKLVATIRVKALHP